MKTHMTLLDIMKGKIGNTLNAVLKPKVQDSAIEGYKLVKDLTPAYTSKINRVGIYATKEDKKVVIKRVLYGYENLDACYTRNEAFLLKTFQEKKLTEKIFPNFIELIQKPHLVAFVTDYCEGQGVDTLSKDEQTTIAKQAFTLLKKMSASLQKDNFSGIPVRKPLSYMLSFIFNLLRVLRKNPSSFLRYMQFTMLFYTSYVHTLWRKTALGLVHRDIYPDNMLYNAKNKAITITDWESALISDSLYDLAQIAMIYSYKENAGEILEFLQAELTTHSEKKRFVGLAIFNSMQILANHRVNHFAYRQTEEFLNTLTNKIMPKLFYKKSLFEIIFGDMLTLMYYFYKVTGLPFYSTSKKIILCYHSIGHNGWRYSMEVDAFKKQMDFLQKHYTLTFLPTLMEEKKAGIAITFDDGYRDVLTNALPLLDKLHVPAVMFALGDEKNPNREELDNTLLLLTKEELVLLKKHGWEIGSHTLTHSYLRHMSDKNLEDEIQKSKAALEAVLRSPIRYFAYPKGIYSNKIVAVVKNAGYTHAFTTNGYEITKEKEKPLLINRILLEHSLTEQQFEALLSPLGLFLSRISIPVLQIKATVGESLKKMLLGLLGNTGIFKKIVISFTILILLMVLLAGFIKGGKNASGLLYQHDYNRNVGGPLEASNSTARYALTESIVKDTSLTLNKTLAQFASPDVVYYDGKFTSIFTPGISLLGIPLYIVGAIFGIPQIATYITILLIAILDVFLIAKISRKIGIQYGFGLISGIIFLFATNALAYSLTFTQHITTVAIILLAILITLSKRTIKTDILFGALCGIGVLVDIPNVFLLLPIALYIIFSHITVQKTVQDIHAKIQWKAIWITAGLIPFVILFGWYNYITTGSPTKLGQTIGRTTAFQAPLPQQVASVSATFDDNASKPIGLKLPFSTRAELDGMYTLLISDERSWIYYCPIVFIGLLGLILLYRKQETRFFSLLCLATIGINILLYAMFTDPWGGWAFGPRYLIPSASVLCLGIGVALQKYKKNLIFLVIFIITFLYSLWVNVLGALTTSAIPPKVEAINLSVPIPWTYQYNLQLLDKNFSSSLLYNLFLTKIISPATYLWILVGMITFVVLVIYMITMALRKETRRNAI